MYVEWVESTISDVEAIEFNILITLTTIFRTESNENSVDQGENT